MPLFYFFISILRQTNCSDQKEEPGNDLQNMLDLYLGGFEYYNDLNDMQFNLYDNKSKYFNDVEMEFEAMSDNYQNIQCNKISDSKLVFNTLQTNNDYVNAVSEFDSIDMTQFQKIVENHVQEPQTELLNDIGINLDVELIKNHGYKKATWTRKEITYLIQKSLDKFDSNEETIEKKIEESLSTDRICNFLIYNYFFYDDLKIKIEYLILLLVIPEINVITLLYSSLENKTIKNIPDVLISEYSIAVGNLIMAYKEALQSFGKKLKKMDNNETEYISMFFRAKLIHQINRFREINSKILETLLNDNYASFSTNSTYDIRGINDYSSNAIKNMHQHSDDITTEYDRKISNKNEHDVLHSANLQIKKIKKNRDGSFNTELKLEKKSKVIRKSKMNPISKQSFQFYNTLNSRKNRIKGKSSNKLNEKLYFVLFLNKDWLEPFTNIPINLFGFMVNVNELKLTKGFYDKIKYFKFIHHNLHVFLKIFYNKYITIEYERCVDPTFNGHKLILKRKAISKGFETTVPQYYEYIFDKYYEFLFRYYIGSI